MFDKTYYGIPFFCVFANYMQVRTVDRVDADAAMSEWYHHYMISLAQGK